MSFEALSSSANLSAASQVAIRANGLGKHYHIYAKPHDRLLQTIWRGKRQFYRDFQALENINFELARGQTLGTLLYAVESPLAARKQWLADHLQLAGSLTLDAGAL